MDDMTGAYDPLVAKTQLPALCVGAALIKNDRVLLGLRSKSLRTYADRWDVFGGHVEHGESVMDALSRELKEELGIETIDTEFVGVFSGEEPVTLRAFNLHLYCVTSWSGEFTLCSEEHQQLAWFASEEISEMPNLADPSMASVLTDLIHRSAKP